MKLLKTKQVPLYWPCRFICCQCLVKLKRLKRLLHAAEWRSKEGKSLTGLPMYDESMGLQRDGQDSAQEARVPKRVRMDQAGGGEITVPIRQIATPEDGGNETQERVPIPRSSL